MDYQTIIYEKRHHVGWITLNRPEKLNALNYVMRHEICDALADIAQDDDIRVGVVNARGRAFSAGADLTYGPAPEGDETDYDNRDIAFDFYEGIWQNPKPIIASVHGYCLARGGDLASFCDLTVAADNTLFGYPILWSSPHVQANMWPWTIGFKLTKDLILTGRYMDANEALQQGLVNRVVPLADLEHETEKLALLLANAAEKITQKRMLNQAWDRALGVSEFFHFIWEPKRRGRWGENDPINRKFRDLVRDEGMQAALAWREARKVEGLRPREE